MKPVTPIHEPRVPPPAPPKYDYAAARAAGATPLLIVLHKAHRYLAKAYLVWMIAFVLGIIVYHSTGKTAEAIKSCQQAIQIFPSVEYKQHTKPLLPTMPEHRTRGLMKQAFQASHVFHLCSMPLI